MNREKRKSPTTRKKLFSVGIDDCRVEYIASTGGGGGQNKNRRHTAVRITHPPSGAVGYSADERDQWQNKQRAFIRMANSPDFVIWNHKMAADIISGESVEKKVDKAMQPEHIKIEVRKDGKWTEVTDDECDCMDCSIAGEPTH